MGWAARTNPRSDEFARLSPAAQGLVEAQDGRVFAQASPEAKELTDQQRIRELAAQIQDEAQLRRILDDVRPQSVRALVEARIRPWVTYPQPLPEAQEKAAFDAFSDAFIRPAVEHDPVGAARLLYGEAAEGYLGLTSTQRAAAVRIVTDPAPPDLDALAEARAEVEDGYVPSWHGTLNDPTLDGGEDDHAD